MSGQGSGSEGPRRSDRLAKGKAVLYEPESPPDTDDEYEAMEDVRTRVDASIARNLQDELDAEAAGLTSSAVRPSSRPGITIGRSARPSSRPGITIDRSARPSGAPRQSSAKPAVAPPARSKRRRSDRPLFPRILYRRIMLPRGLDILLRVAFDRAILLLLQWWIRHS